jgi:hypothetical protein
MTGPMQKLMLCVVLIRRLIISNLSSVMKGEPGAATVSPAGPRQPPGPQNDNRRRRRVSRVRKDETDGQMRAKGCDAGTKAGCGQSLYPE